MGEPMNPRTAIIIGVGAEPWAARAAELEATEGPYCGFAAWEEWMGRHLDDDLKKFDYAGVLETLDACQQAYLYNLMSRLAAGEVGA